MVSMAGLVTNTGISTYYGSKFAQEAFTSCLRMELKAFDIDVISVNPSVHETPMNTALGTQISKIWEKLSPHLKEEYGSGKSIYIDSKWKMHLSRNILKVKLTQMPFILLFLFKCQPKEYFSKYYSFICEDHIKTMWKAKNVEDKLIECVETVSPPPQVLIGSNAIYQSMIFRMLPMTVQIKILERVCPLNTTKAAKMNAK